MPVSKIRNINNVDTMHAKLRERAKREKIMLIWNAKKILLQEVELPVKINIVKEYLLENKELFKNNIPDNKTKLLNDDIDSHYMILVSGWKFEDNEKVLEGLEKSLKKAYPNANYQEGRKCGGNMLKSKSGQGERYTFWPAGGEWDSYKYRYFDDFTETNQCMYDSEVKIIQEKYIQDNLDRKVIELKLIKNSQVSSPALSSNNIRSKLFSRISALLTGNNLRGGRITNRVKKNRTYKISKGYKTRRSV